MRLRGFGIASSTRGVLVTTITLSIEKSGQRGIRRTRDSPWFPDWHPFSLRIPISANRDQAIHAPIEIREHKSMFDKERHNSGELPVGAAPGPFYENSSSNLKGMFSHNDKSNPKAMEKSPMFTNFGASGLATIPIYRNKCSTPPYTWQRTTTHRQDR